MKVRTIFSGLLILALMSFAKPGFAYGMNAKIQAPHDHAYNQHPPSHRNYHKQHHYHHHKPVHHDHPRPH